MVLMAAALEAFKSLVTIPLAGVGALTDEGKAARWVLLATVISALLALVDPGAERIIITAGLIAAAYLGAHRSGGRSDMGLWAGGAASWWGPCYWPYWVNGSSA